VTLESNQALIIGAQLKAAMIEAGSKLGLTEAETIATASRTYRRQKRADETLTKEDIAREIIQSGNAISDPSYADDTKYLDKNEQARAFGQMQDDIQTYRADDRGFTQDPETGLVVREQLTDQKPIETGLVPTVETKRNRKTGKLFGIQRDVEEPLGYEGANAPKSALVDALTALESEIERPKTSAIDRIALALGGSAVDLEAKTARDALRENLVPERAQDARVGRALVGQDRQMREAKAIENLRAIAIAQQEAGRPLSRAQATQLLQELLPEGAKRFSDENVFRETQNIAREGFLTGGQAALADEAIGRIGEIRSLGKTSEPAMVQKVMPADEAVRTQVTQRSDGIYLDDAGNPVAIQGPEPGPRPKGPRSVREYIADNLYQANSQGIYPQVDIGVETSSIVNKFNDYLRRNQMQGARKTDVRSVGELQRLINTVQRVRTESERPNVKLDYSVQPPKQISAGDDRVGSAMFEMGVDQFQQQRLANAMYQLDTASRSSVNENPTGIYLSRMTKVGPAMQGENINRDGGLMTGATEPMIDPRGISFETMRYGTRSRKTGRDLKTAIKSIPTTNKPTTEAVVALDANRPTQKQAPLSTLLSGQVYNRTRYAEGSPEFRPNAMVQTSPEGIRNFLTQQAVERGNTFNLESNIVNAQAVQRRADKDTSRRASQMSDIIAGLPPTARRSPINRRA